MDPRSGSERTAAEPAAGLVDGEIAAVVQAEPAVLAAYVFGSIARGAATTLSDLDVALLLREPSDVDVVGRVIDAVCRRLRTDRVDVVSLRETPVPLRYRVAREGTLVFCRDAAARERFTAETVLEYLDFQPLRDRALFLVRDAILENR